MREHLGGAVGAVHIVLQSKGGVAKSFAALHLAQYFADQGLPTAVFDSDPATSTLANYKALNVPYIDLMNDDDFDARQFDAVAKPASCGSEQLPAWSSAAAGATWRRPAARAL